MWKILTQNIIVDQKFRFNRASVISLMKSGNPKTLDNLPSPVIAMSR